MKGIELGVILLGWSANLQYLGPFWNSKDTSSRENYDTISFLLLFVKN